MTAPGSVQKSEEEWRAVLSPEQFRILRQKGTEGKGTGEYDKFFGEGVYNCAGCGTPLYKSTSKFNSGCGWPAFFEGLPGAVVGLLSLRVFLVQSTAPRTLMGGEPKLRVQPAVGIWAMFLKARGFQHLQTNAIASTVFQSSSSLRIPLLPCDNYKKVVMQEPASFVS